MAALPHKFPKPSLKQRGKAMLSLVELMVAIAIMGAVGAMISGFLYTSSLSLTYSNQNLLVDNSLRILSELFTRDAGICDYFLLYKTGTEEDYDSAEKRLGPGEWGDMAVFVRLGAPVLIDKEGLYKRPIQHLYVVLRTPPNGEALWHYKIEATPDEGLNATVEELLTEHPPVLGENAAFIAKTAPTGDDKRMLYNLDGQSLLANIELYQQFRDRIQSVSLNFISTCPSLF